MKSAKEKKRAVLGIDAAWTERNPSGVALVSEDGKGRWRCDVIAPSYDQFINACENHGNMNWVATPQGSWPNVNNILNAARSNLEGKYQINVIAVDMPLSLESSIRRRRAADNDVSRLFGAKGCAAHSPTVERPGALSADLRGQCNTAGYTLRVNNNGRVNGRGNSLIEVYPHTVALHLTKSNYRIPYKVSKSGKYWPGKSVDERKHNLLCKFQMLLNALEDRMDIPNFTLPDCSAAPNLSHLKRYEDALDALMCAWMGIEYLEDRSRPVGDANAAIWLPNLE
ncbi:MAG: DUF429 domain-containing protein [Nitrospinae bacterium]|nr:DUF429 domain-containing protein [Nitrospinota bacterium]